MSGEGGLSSAMEGLRALNFQALDYELRTLFGIRDWAIDHLGIDYRAGDKVRIVSPRPGQSMDGWATYAECLHVGAIGTATRIRYAPPCGDRPGRWDANFVPDREWAVGNYPPGTVTRYWKGPAAETPEGFEPPSKYDAEHYPGGKRHTFMFDVTWLAAVSPAEPHARIADTAEQEEA